MTDRRSPIPIRLSAAELATIRMASRAEGIGYTTWIRRVALAAATVSAAEARLRREARLRLVEAMRAAHRATRDGGAP